MKREVKHFTVSKILNLVDRSAIYVIHDEAKKLIFKCRTRLTAYGFAERLSESGHVVEFDDSVDMSEEQLLEEYVTSKESGV